MQKKLYCLAEFKAKPGKEDYLYKTLQNLEEETHKEKGCEFYKVMKKVENPFATGKHFGIVFNEVWATVEDFNKHNTQPHIINFFNKECLDKENGSVQEWNVNVFERIEK